MSYFPEHFLLDHEQDTHDDLLRSIVPPTMFDVDAAKITKQNKAKRPGITKVIETLRTSMKLARQEAEKADQRNNYTTCLANQVDLLAEETEKALRKLM